MRQSKKKKNENILIILCIVAELNKVKEIFLIKIITCLLTQL